MLRWLDEHRYAWAIARSPRAKYPALVSDVLALAGAGARVLKTDAWNEAAPGREAWHGAAPPWAACIEKDPVAVERARRHWPTLDIREGDIREIPWPAGAFDVVVDLSTIDHVADPMAAIDEYFRVVTPGGLLLEVVWLAPKPAYGPSDHGGTQYVFAADGFRLMLAPLFQIVDARVLTPAGGNPDGVIRGVRVPGVDLWALVCRRRV